MCSDSTGAEIRRCAPWTESRSISIAARWWGISGPSGSGKSTLLLIAGLLEPPSAGEVLIDGRRVSHPAADLDRLRTFRRNHIGFIFQKANLIPFLTAVETWRWRWRSTMCRRARRGPMQARCSPALTSATGSTTTPPGYRGRLQGAARWRGRLPRRIRCAMDEPTAALDSARVRCRGCSVRLPDPPGGGRAAPLNCAAPRPPTEPSNSATGGPAMLVHGTPGAAGTH